MYNLIVSLAVLTSLFLVLIILAQNPKGGGLSSQFGGAGASNFIGVKKTGNLLENLTWGSITVIILLSLGAQFGSTSSERVTDPVLERAKEEQPLVPSLQDIEAIDKNSDAEEIVPQDSTP